MVKRYSKIEPKDGRETIFIDEIGYSKGSFQDDVRKYANGLLNSHGGVIYFGVSSSGTVRGKTISRREEDELRLAVDHAFGGFQPFVSSQHYRLTFIPLDNCNYTIIELKVSIGELGEIYEDGRLKVYIIDSAQLIGPLHPQELKELILLKYKQSIEGAEEAAKYCTPNLSRAKTIALTAKKTTTSMATIPELPSVEKLPPVKITRISGTAINETKATPKCATPTNVISASSTNIENVSKSNTATSSTTSIHRESSATDKDNKQSSTTSSTTSLNVTATKTDRYTSDRKDTPENTKKPPANTTQHTSKSNSHLMKSTPKIRANVARTHSVSRTPIYHRHQENYVHPMQFNNLPAYNRPTHHGYNRPVNNAYNQMINYRQLQQLPNYTGFF